MYGTLGRSENKLQASVFFFHLWVLEQNSGCQAGWQATLPPFWSGPLIFNSTNIKGLILPLQFSCLQFYSLWASKCDSIKSIQIFWYRIYERITVSRMVRTQGLRQPTGHKINSNNITMKAVHKTRKVNGLRLDYLKQLIMHTSFITFLKVLTALCVREGRMSNFFYLNLQVGVSLLIWVLGI